MQRRLPFLTFLITGVCCSFLLLSQCNRSEEFSPNQNQTSASATGQQPPPELAEYMSQLQYYTHKLALSVVAENTETAGFYFHEVTELSDLIEKDVPEYEGYDIAGMMQTVLKPEITAVDKALSANDFQETRSRLITLVEACNTCHKATNHGFILVTPGFDKNPYNQVFTP